MVASWLPFVSGDACMLQPLLQLTESRAVAAHCTYAVQHLRCSESCMCLKLEHGIQIRVVGNWMSKIEGLLRRIVRLRQVAPEEKSLVFSQYPDALKLVGKALNVNNINWVELRGGAKVSVSICFCAKCPTADCVLPMLLISMTV